MNWKPNQAPIRAIAPMFARTSAPERRIPRRTSGAGVRFSWATNAARMPNAAARDPSVRAEVQPASGASTTVNTNSSIPAVTAIAPATSKLPFVRATRPESGTRRMAASSVISARGTGNTKTQRQPSSVRRPLKTRPSENPVAPVAV